MDIGFLYDLRNEERAREHALAFADAITARGGQVRLESFRYPGSDLKGGFYFHISGVPIHEANAILDSIRSTNCG